MNPAGSLTDEQKDTLKAEVRKMKATEFKHETWCALGQMLQNFNWLMGEQMGLQADVQEMQQKVDDIIDFLRQVVESDSQNTTHH